VPNDRGRGQADGGVTIAVETRFDGSFFFSHMAAGTYFVIASYPGYVSPYVALSLAEARSQYGTWQPLGPSQQAAKELVLKTIPRITIQSSQPATIDVSLERRAAISGNITYDDGTPAAGLSVTVLARMTQDGKETWAPFKPPPNSPPQVYTDDRGGYRVTGLPARKYIVQVMLDLGKTITYISSAGTRGIGSSGSSLTFYSGSTPRLKDAAVLALDLGEERVASPVLDPSALSSSSAIRSVQKRPSPASLVSSPWIRGEPQVGFSATRRKMSSRSSTRTHFLPERIRCRESEVQESLKPAGSGSDWEFRG
jgi:hypothetical protein